MVDFDTAKIISMEAVFPETDIFLCDFHREQSWNRRALWILLQWKQISFEVDVFHDISFFCFITKCFVDLEEENSYVTNNSNVKLLRLFFSLMEIFR